MNHTVTARETREMFRQLDRIKELTDLLRRTHFDVPYRTVYAAAGAEAMLRERLLSAALTDIEVEADREDGEPPRCKSGDGPCKSLKRCRALGRCGEDMITTEAPVLAEVGG